FYDRTVSGYVGDVDGSMPGFSSIPVIFPNGAGNTDVRLADGLQLPPQPTSPLVLLPATRTQTVSIINPNLRTGYIHDFGLAIQHEFFRNTIGEIAYVGTRGVKLYLDEDLDQPRAYGDFLKSFKELQTFQANSTLPSAANTIVKLFGTPTAAVNGIGATNLQQ